MAIRLDAWMDFTCPFCFLTTLAIKKLAFEFPLDVHWRSFQVRPPGSLPPSDESRALSESDRREAAKRARNEFGIILRPGPIGMNTRLPHIEVQFAKSAGKDDAFYSAAMDAYWLSARAIDAPGIIQKIAVQVGLDANAAGFALTNLKLSHQMDADRYEAESLGMHIIPALLFEHNQAYAGDQSYQTLRQFIQSLPQQSGSAAAAAGTL